MKKLISLLFIVLLSLSVAACAKEPTPSETTSIFLDNIKSESSDENGQFLEGINKNLGDSPVEMVFKNEVMPKINDFDYEIKKEKISGKDSNKAVVTVEITTYPIGKAYNDFITEFINSSITSAEEGKSEDEIANIAASIFSQKLKNMKKDYKEEVEFILTKTDNGWEINKLSQSAINAFTGDLLDTVSEINTKLQNGQL